MKKTTFFMGFLTGTLLVGVLSLIMYSALGLGTRGSDQMKKLEQINKIVNGNESDSGELDLNTFQQKINEIDSLVNKHYYETYDQNAMWESAIRGYLSGLGDPYAAYYSQEQLIEFMEDANGSYEGIGVVVSFSENGEDIVVVGPFKGSPGEKAGILPGDIIMKVNDLDITGYTLEEVVKEIKGPKGTDVVVTVYRESEGKTLDLTITRDEIHEQTVAYEMLPGDIGYMIITGFQEVTYGQFVEAIQELDKQNQKGLIIDLRNNPGGLVETVKLISDELLPEGLIVYTEDKNGKRTEYKSDAEHQFTKPLVILVNGYSASASEILAGAVKDHKIGTIVGTTTYGKGLVQSTYQLDDGSAVKLTVARYFTPLGNYINEVGIEPDIVVELPGQYKNYLTVPQEYDTQLQKAIEVIESQF